jgi:hypothetical protein
MNNLTNYSNIKFKFDTILEYLNVLSTLSNALQLNVKQKIRKSHHILPEVFNKKLKLIDFTYKNLVLEKQQVDSDDEFAFLGCSWIAPKGYYLLFTQQCLLLYLLTDEENHINCDHKLLRNCFDEKLKNGSISFNYDIFNQVRSYELAKKYKTTKGSIFSKTTQEKLGLVLKINYRYAEEEFKRRENIKSYHSQKNKDKREKFLSSNNTSLYHFFYHMRIKSNYRDLEFMRYSEIVTDFSDFRKFYNDYYKLIDNFYKAYNLAIENLLKIKF